VIDELPSLVGTVWNVDANEKPVVSGSENVVLGPIISEGLIVKVRPFEVSVVGTPLVMVSLPKTMAEGPKMLMGIPSTSPVVLGPGNGNVVLGPMISEGLIVKVSPFEMIVVGAVTVKV
jgi:hypothetical protein